MAFEKPKTFTSKKGNEFTVKMYRFPTRFRLIAHTLDKKIAGEYIGQNSFCDRFHDDEYIRTAVLVEEEYRGQGLGSILFDCLVEELKEQKMPHIVTINTDKEAINGVPQDGRLFIPRLEEKGYTYAGEYEDEHEGELSRGLVYKKIY